ncbi:XrtY-associated glycosyltransferase XYAG1 [Paradesertivirga mongoliensis]|uniref:XrtY-associated glycosyltransferase XYAG1 n=1 Tax=Paradesertivirga mongoliensis TaxID=2100740 RepID=A0ABW4ZGR1_9SPHI|nr:glycosyltransferase [Pedobacter mongoliensis]
MKLIQINASYKPAFIYGGPTMSVSKLSEVLAARNLAIEVLTTSANGMEELNIQPGESVVVDNVPITYYKRLTKDHTHFSPALYLALWNKLTESKSRQTIVHIHTWWNLVSVLSCLVALIKKATVVLSPRGTLSSYSFGNRNNAFKSVIFALSKPMLKGCHLHATSENEKTALLQLLQPESISVIPNLVSLPSETPTRSQSKTEDNLIKLLFFSRVEHKKGLELLFQALSGINIHFSLTVAGPGESSYIEQLKRLADDYKIGSKISWIGNQPPEKKFDIMAAHDLLVLPSYDENFANVVIESLASGTPVLITKNVGLSDYVEQHDLGWVCTFDVDDLKGSLLSAGEDSEKRERIRETAPDKIRRDFSDENLAEQYIEMYERILGQGRI